MKKLHTEKAKIQSVWPVQLWVCENFTFEAISGHLTQFSPIHASPATESTQSNPIQSMDESNPCPTLVRCYSNVLVLQGTNVGLRVDKGFTKQRRALCGASCSMVTWYHVTHRPTTTRWRHSAATVSTCVAQRHWLIDAPTSWVVHPLPRCLQRPHGRAASDPTIYDARSPTVRSDAAAISFYTFLIKYR